MNAAEFGRMVGQAQAEVFAGLLDLPYRRPGSPLLLTAAQWENYDRFGELYDRMDAKYGALRTRAGLAPAALTVRGVW